VGGDHDPLVTRICSAGCCRSCSLLSPHSDRHAAASEQEHWCGISLRRIPDIYPDDAFVGLVLPSAECLGDSVSRRPCGLAQISGTGSRTQTMSTVPCARTFSFREDRQFRLGCSRLHEYHTMRRGSPEPPGKSGSGRPQAAHCRTRILSGAGGASCGGAWRSRHPRPPP
jgi:hypothetical protein